MQSNLMQETEDYSDELEPGTLLLRGQYEIESYLVRGGFGITYLARDSLERRVVIKECFPSTICHRVEGIVQARARDQQKQFSSLLRHFLREARRLARLAHSNIVGVHQVFEENGTAYMALDYVDGQDLLSIVEETPERLEPDLVRSLLIKSLGAINYIHDKGILHRDISPDNILLDGADNLTLIDFGAAREHATKENRALSALLAVKDGYSPQEFYLADVTQCPSSDLYALGATFYHLITGDPPPHSQQRLAAVAGNTPDPFEPLAGSEWCVEYDDEFLAAIDKALMVFPEDRFQSAQDWVEVIDAERRRQAAAVRARSDSSINLRISKLVEDTNRNLNGGSAEGNVYSRRRPSRLVEATPMTPVFAEEEKDKVQPVDIFGNPIEDVEAWLLAQDKAADRPPREDKRRQADRNRGSLFKRRGSGSEDNTNQEAEPQLPRFFRSLVGRLGQDTPDPQESA